MHKDNFQYISLKQASEFSDYSQDYLSLRARQGKLKAVKLGRNWVTTQEWLDEYVSKAEEYKEGHNGNWVNHTPEDNRDFTYKRPVLPHAIIAVAILVFILFSGGVVLGRYGNSILKPLSSTVNSAMVSINLGIDKVIKDLTENQAFQYASKSIKYTSEYLTEYIEYLPKTKSGQYVFKNVKDINEKIIIGANVISSEISKTEFAKYIKEVSKYVSKQTIVFINIISEKILNNKLLANIETLVSKIQFPDYIKSSISENVKNFKKFTGEITSKIFAPIKKSYEFVIRPWKIIPSSQFEVSQKEFGEGDVDEINNITESKGLQEQRIVTEKLIQEVSKITQVESVKEITKQIIKIDDEELEKLKADISAIQKWEDDIKNLQILTSKLKTNPPYTQVTTAPIYIGSQGIEVGGVGIFSSLGVSGSAGITNLGVGNSTSLGSDSSSKLNVQATSEFFSPVTIQNTFTVGDSTNYLTIDSTGNLNTTGDVTIIGDLAVTGGQTYSGAAAFTASSTSATLSVNQTGNGDIVNFQDSGTTIFAISDGGDITMTGNLTTDGNVTISGNLTVTGGQTYSGAAAFTASSTSAALSVNQTGSGDIVNFQGLGTTVFAISNNGNITMTGDIIITGPATTTGSMYAETYYSSSTDSTVRKSGEEILRASVSIYRYEMPSQTSTTTYFRISKYFTNNPLSSSPPVFPGATRVYRLIIKYSDNIATTSNSSWRIYRTAAATTSDTFNLSGLAESQTTEGTPYLTDILSIPDTDWQLEMRLPSDLNQIRIFQIYLSAYDQIN